MGSSAAAKTRPAGRPRDESIDAAVLAAAAAVLDEVGYPRLSVAAVAARAGVHKPALYRRWRSKPLLVIDVLATTLPPLLFPDTGTLRGDLEAGVHSLRDTWSAPRIRQTFLGLFADLMGDPEANQSFHTRVLRTRGSSLHEVLARARQRDEAGAALDSATVASLLEGPLMHRVLLDEHPIDEALVSTVIAAICAVAAQSR
jgi:AcrR family transcriptional regulator